SGERLEELTGTRLLSDGLENRPFPSATEMPPRLELVVSTALSLLGTLVLMLPVSWVYMAVQRNKGQGMTIVQTLIILPLAVAGIVLVVRNSLALAFSLAGVLAGVRFRTRIGDARDLVFIFLAIGVGFAAGVQAMTVAAVLSVIINFVLLFTWRYGFGRNLLEPSPAATQWAEPLQELARETGEQKVPDRDVLLALTPDKVRALGERFDRLLALTGGNGGGAGKKPFNAILWATAKDVTAAQRQIEPVLDQTVKRWALDEVITESGKPSQLYYLLRVKKGTTKDAVLTAVRAGAGQVLESAEVELGAAMTADGKKQ
ncbi:MAG: DUF4956 domain-containing protein, partial [Gemmatimonadales bacterium]